MSHKKKSNKNTKLLAVRDIVERGGLLGTEGLDELLVGGLVARLGKKDELSASSLDDLDALVKSTRETVSGKSVLAHTTNSGGQVSDLLNLDGSDRSSFGVRHIC